MSVIIKPTVGRVVWYYPAPGEPIESAPPEPLSAMIARVWNDQCVNLVVFDAGGQPHGRRGITLAQDDEERLGRRGAYCTWMPYQKGQAGKTEAAEAAALGAAARSAGQSSY